MQRLITITDFKNGASRYITEAEQGDTILICRGSAPIAQLSPIPDDVRTALAAQQNISTVSGEYASIIVPGSRRRFQIPFNVLPQYLAVLQDPEQVIRVSLPDGHAVVLPVASIEYLEAPSEPGLPTAPAPDRYAELLTVNDNRFRISRLEMERLNSLMRECMPVLDFRPLAAGGEFSDKTIFMPRRQVRSLYLGS
jgi:antitoxin (DNA-binding transcriptional repressor) of toxin-antitoxin stability system